MICGCSLRPPPPNRRCGETSVGSERQSGPFVLQDCAGARPLPKMWAATTRNPIAVRSHRVAPLFAYTHRSTQRSLLVRSLPPFSRRPPVGRRHSGRHETSSCRPGSCRRPVETTHQLLGNGSGTPQRNLEDVRSLTNQSGGRFQQEPPPDPWPCRTNQLTNQLTKQH